MRSLGLIFDLLSGVKPGFANPNGSTEFLTAVTAQLKYAKELNSPQINLKSGKRFDTLPREAQHKAAVENLKRAADLAAANQVQIVIEPIDPLEDPTIYLTTVTEGFEIVREVASPQVRVLYDFYHEQRALRKPDREAGEEHRTRRSGPHSRRSRASRARHRRDRLHQYLPQARRAQVRQ